MEGLIEKKILYSGSKEQGKSDFVNGSKVTYHFQTLKTDESNTTIDDTKKHKPMELILGKQFKLEVMEACIKTMALNEVASFTIDKSLLHAYPTVSKALRDSWNPEKKKEQKRHCCGYGLESISLGYPDLDDLAHNPQNLQFIIELLKVETPGEYEKESWAMDESEKLSSIEKLRKKGNEEYRLCNYNEAEKHYHEALSRLESLLLREKPGDEDWKKLDLMKIPLLLNYSQCKLLKKEYYETINHCTAVLDKDPVNVKALYRRGRAHHNVWNFLESRNDLTRAMELDKSIANVVKKELELVDKKEKDRNEEERSKYQGKMFN